MFAQQKLPRVLSGRKRLLAFFGIFLFFWWALPASDSDINRLERVVSERDEKLEIIEKLVLVNRNNVMRRLPDVIGIGVKECGSKDVFSFLKHHPLVKIPRAESQKFYLVSGMANKLGYYRKVMPLVNDMQRIVQNIPIYFDHPSSTLPEFIKSVLPQVKLLLTVCEPATRLYSEYVSERKKFRSFDEQPMVESRTFDDFVNRHLPKLLSLTAGLNETSAPAIGLKLSNVAREDLAISLVSRGLYAAHIQRWRKFFDRSSLMVIDGDRFSSDPGPIMEEIQDFLMLPKVLLKEDFVSRNDTGFCYRRTVLSDIPESDRKDSKQGIAQSTACLAQKNTNLRQEHQKSFLASLEVLRQFYEPFNRLFRTQEGLSLKWLS